MADFRREVFWVPMPRSQQSLSCPTNLYHLPTTKCKSVQILNLGIGLIFGKAGNTIAVISIYFFKCYGELVR